MVILFHERSRSIGGINAVIRTRSTEANLFWKCQWSCSLCENFLILQKFHNYAFTKNKSSLVTGHKQAIWKRYFSFWKVCQKLVLKKTFMAFFPISTGVGRWLPYCSFPHFSCSCTSSHFHPRGTRPSSPTRPLIPSISYNMLFFTHPVTIGIIFLCLFSMCGFYSQ